ncbi:MAG: dethiobiotin synthase [Thiolinea sp.]
MELEHWLDSMAQGPGLFVTGTDTGVGKTWVGVRLLARLRSRHRQIIPRKPVESGWPDDAEQLQQTDAWQLAQATGHIAQLDQVCPNRFSAPLSPPRAAQLQGQTLKIAELAAQCRQHVPAAAFLYVEGAGGLYSPLAQDGLNADLAQALKLPVVLVTEDRVGCINHVLLCVEALQQRGLQLAAVLLNPMQAAPAGMDNQQDLRELLDQPVWRWDDSL